MSAFENQTTEALRARMETLMASDRPNETESAELLELVTELERRDDASLVRVDTEAALRRFRETFLPTVAEPRPRRLPAFLAAFSGGKSPSPQEEDDLRRMIEAYRKEEP